MALEGRNIRRRHRPDAEGGDGCLLQRRVEGDVGGDAQLAADVVAVDVGGGVRLGVAQVLGLLQNSGEVHRSLVHGVHDKVGGAVHNTAHGAHRIQPLHALQIRQPGYAAAHGGGAAQGRALLPGQCRELRVIGGDQCLVGRDHVLALRQRGGDIFIGRVQPAHDLHHRVDFRVIEDVIGIEGDHLLRQALFGTAEQHTLHIQVIARRAQRPHAAAYHAKAQQTDMHHSRYLLGSSRLRGRHFGPIVPANPLAVKANPPTHPQNLPLAGKVPRRGG